MPKLQTPARQYTFGLDAAGRARRQRTAETYSRLAAEAERALAKCKPGGARALELQANIARYDGIIERCVQGV